ncbi:MAG TPA: hypothetical protein VER12_18480 [Polyangiaceae bacterium]|nr:hypothetical protein [Polyangiaceae bacterium]
MNNRLWGVVLAGCSLLACGQTSTTNSDTNSEDGGNVQLGPGSWDVTGVFSTGVVSAEPVQSYFCEKLEFALTVDRDTITVGHDGVMYAAPVQIVDGAYVATSLDLPMGSCNAERLLVDQLRLRGIDTNGDGEADELEGTSTLDQVRIVSGDTYRNAKLSIALKAVPDDSQPKLLRSGEKLLRSGEMINPLDRVSVSASEPVDASTQVRLTGTTTLPLVAAQGSERSPSGPVIAFYSSQILPLGGSWQIEAEGQDLAGHPLALDPASNRWSTLADPGVYTPDGFEGALSGVSGASETVTGYGSIPAISGAHSLWLEASSNLRVHLRRRGAEKKLHFMVRAFSTSKSSGSAYKTVRAGVLGGTQVVTLAYENPLSQARDATGEASLPWVGDAIEFDAELDDPGQDVLLSIDNSYCLDGFCRPSAWMIDDLTLQ